MKQFDIAVRKLKNGNFNEAEKILVKIVSKKPGDSKAWINLGVAYRAEGQLLKAEESYKKALELNPKNAAVYNNLANIFLIQRNFSKAKVYLLKAISIKPKYPQALGNLGVLNETRGNMAEAKSYYNKALKVDPRLPDTLSNLSGILQKEGRLKEALKFSQKALKLSPQNPSALNNLGNIYRDLGDLNSAKINYQKAIELDSQMAGAYSNLLDVLLRLCEWEEADRIHKIVDSMGAETPFMSLRFHSKELARSMNVARAWGQEIAANALRPNLNLGYWVKEDDEKIRVGYISANFGKHPTGIVSLPLFYLHNRKYFEIYAYSYGPNDKSWVRNTVKRSADKFIDLKMKSDVQAARKINRDKIDILVDLTGHTTGGRMGILALRPSPFQISYLGFPGTSGAEFMKYLIADRVVVPPKEQKHYTEKIIYMPGSYQINDREIKPAGKFTKNDFGVGDDTFVFCSFNRPFKFSRGLFNSWMTILKKVPNSVLVLWKEGGSAVKNLQDAAKKMGVDPKRLIFVSELSYDKHLARLSACDLALDTWEYSGGATTSDALSVGAPVITLKGKNYLSRMSDSMLVAVGLPDLIAKTPKEYEKLAIKLANSKLGRVKSRLSKNIKTKSLFNATSFVRSLEKEYFKIMGRG